MFYIFSGSHASLIASVSFNIIFLIVLAFLLILIMKQRRQIAAIRRQLSRLFDAYERSPIIRGSQRISGASSLPENGQDEESPDQEGFVNIRF